MFQPHWWLQHRVSCQEEEPRIPTRNRWTCEMRLQQQKKRQTVKSDGLQRDDNAYGTAGKTQEWDQRCNPLCLQLWSSVSSSVNPSETSTGAPGGADSHVESYLDILLPPPKPKREHRNLYELPVGSGILTCAGATTHFNTLQDCHFSSLPACWTGPLGRSQHKAAPIPPQRWTVQDGHFNSQSTCDFRQRSHISVRII